MKKYFVVDRYRQDIDVDYVIDFLKEERNIKFHTSLEDALQELHNGFYDDSDYGVFSIINDKIKREG
jgi:uncharacterized HAD superfamily protein